MPCVLLLLLLAACGTIQNPASDSGATADAPASSDAAVPTDNAPPIDGSPATDCIGKPFPTTAPSILSFTGRVIDAHDGSPIAGAHVFLVHATSIDFAVSTDAQGNYSGQFATGGKPEDAHLEFSAPSFVRKLRHPSRPFDIDQLTKTEALSDDARMQVLYSISGLTWDDTAAYIAIKIVDCARTGIAHAQLQVSRPGGTLRYFRPVDDPTATDTDDSGVVEILNQPPGSVTITAIAPPPFTQLRSYTIDVDADTFHDLDIQP